MARSEPLVENPHHKGDLGSEQKKLRAGFLSKFRDILNLPPIFRGVSWNRQEGWLGLLVNVNEKRKKEVSVSGENRCFAYREGPTMHSATRQLDADQLLPRDSERS